MIRMLFSISLVYSFNVVTQRDQSRCEMQYWARTTGSTGSVPETRADLETLRRLVQGDFSFSLILIIICLCFNLRMVMTTRGGSSSGSGSGPSSGTEPIDERLHEFIVVEVTRGILDATLVMFNTINEGIMYLMDERLMYFKAEIVAGQIGAQTPSFMEFKA